MPRDLRQLVHRENRCQARGRLVPKIMEPQVGQKALVRSLLCFAALLDVELPRPRNSALERPRDCVAADAEHSPRYPGVSIGALVAQGLERGDRLGR